VLSGLEFLTVFDGAAGVALDTVDYAPPRGDAGSWGDAYGNRVDRFQATTAYLDGEHPSMVFSRGCYTRAVIVAFDFDGEELPGPARGVPGKVSVEVEDAEGGRIEVEAWIAYGANAQRMALLVDGEVVRTVELVDRTPRKR
jgi:hypothetical protein